MTAARPPLPSGPVASPCISVCRIDPHSGYCEGCLRTLDEIATWGTMGDERRNAVWAELRERRARRGHTQGR